MRIKIHLLSILFFVGLSSEAQTSNYRFINFGVKEGLTDNFAYCATQDKQGYMWFGTPTGLFRYDGHVFKYFRSSIDKPGRAISNILQTILTDKNGTLWLGGFNTLQWYDPKKNIFWGPNYADASIVKLCNAYILSFTETTNAMWIATSNNYFYNFNKADSSFIHFGDVYPKNASKTTSKIIIAGNEIWAVHQEGLYHFTKDKKYAGFYPIDTDGITNAIYDANTLTIQLTTFSKGICEFSIETKQFHDGFSVNKTLNKNNLFCIIKDKSGSNWIGSYPMYQVNKDKTEIITIESKKETEYDLKTTKIGNLFFDRENNLWICGYGGLSMMPWQNQQISKINLVENNTGIVVEPLGISAIPGSANALLINSNTGGLLTYNTNTHKIATIVNTMAKAKNAKRIIGLINTPDGNFYASDDEHFFKVQLQENKLIPIELKDQHGKAIASIGRNVFDKTGTIYISSPNNGFYTWNLSSGTLTHYNKWDIDTATAAKADNILHPTLVDADNNIWFTGTSGVYKYNTSEKKYYHYAYSTNGEVPLLTSSNFITQDKLGHYWITTLNNGLYELYFENEKEVLKNYNQNSGIGLPSDYIIKVKPDLTDSSLWISYNAGLIKFDPIQKRVQTIFKQQNGLSADAGGYTFNIMPDNKLIQLHYGSLNSIDLNNYEFNKQAPVVVFTSIKVFDKEKLYGLSEGPARLNLSNNENYLQFEFAALYYNNSNQNQYAYQLQGADKDWVYCGNKNTVLYSGLASGKYVFKVKAANNDGVWSYNELTLEIYIHPPFYKTWWFIGLSLLLITGLFFFWNRYRVNEVKKEEKLKSGFQQQIAQTEMKALRAQMNPHFIFNSLNSIQKYILQNDHFAASQYLTKFSRLIRLILDHSNQNNILLNSELDLLKLYIEMEALRFDNKFNYIIDVADDCSENSTEIPSMLIQPYVENAIWHGLLHKNEKGNLSVTFKKSGNHYLEVTIEDDGIGREKANELKSKQVLKNKSYGIKITEDRIAIINTLQNINATCIIEDIRDENNNVKGTKVILTIPVKNLNRE